MIRFIASHFVDHSKYDLCVQRNELKLPYAHSWYLNCVSEQWDCLVLNDYDAVWPLPFRIKWGLKYYFRPYGIQQLGIFSKKPLSDEQVAAFVAEMTERIRYADLYLNEGQALSLGSKKNLSITPKPNLVLALSRSYEQVYSGYNSNLKRKLKKSAKSKLELFENDSAERVLQLFKEEKGSTLGLQEAFYKSFKTLLFQLMHKSLVRVYTVYGGPNILLAGAVFLEYQGRSIFLLSASSEMGRDENALAFLINEYLIYHSEKLDFLDFEGSESPGLAQFYKSFGSVESSFARLVYNRLPWPISLLKR